MIYVTQGHERGIGLEIFLKSFLLLSKAEKKKVTLVVNEKDFNTYIVDLKFHQSDFSELNCLFTSQSSNTPSSTTSLLSALEKISPDDLLITLPTSKDQLVLNNQQLAGYTEFFRSYFKNNNISMTFKGIEQNVLLITDHIALKDVTIKITKDLICHKTLLTIDFFEKYFFPFEEIIFSGINPHIGENGILGNEDKVVFEAVNSLSQNSSIKFKGPFSGDTLHMHRDNNVKQLFVYMFHDQGLAPFKSEYGLIGVNLTMGLPFLRLSVDHGTAFELYGKNKANVSGMMFLFKQAFEVLQYVDKRN